jgi:flagellar assembly protein FliH
MQSSYRIYKNQEISYEIEEKEIPLKDNNYIDKLGVSSSQANSLFRKAKEEANRIVEVAKDKENEVYNKAIDDAAVIIEEKKNEAYLEGMIIGKKDGFDEGYKEGLLASEEESNHILGEAKETLNNALEESKKIILDSQEKIIELSLKIAEEIIKKEVELDDSIIVGITKAALYEVRNLKHIIIKILPEHQSIIEDNISSFKDICPDAYFTVLKDASLKDNGCIIETDKQIIDATIDSQLDVVKSILFEVRD